MPVRVRRERTDRDISGSYQAERYTLWLRTIWFPITEITYVIPVVATLIIGGWYAVKGWATLGQVTAATLYVQQLIDPLEEALAGGDGDGLHPHALVADDARRIVAVVDARLERLHSLNRTGRIEIIYRLAAAPRICISENFTAEA